jgi:hypothetical protein
VSICSVHTAINAWTLLNQHEKLPYVVGHVLLEVLPPHSASMCCSWGGQMVPLTPKPGKSTSGPQFTQSLIWRLNGWVTFNFCIALHHLSNIFLFKLRFMTGRSTLMGTPIWVLTAPTAEYYKRAEPLPPTNSKRSLMSVMSWLLGFWQDS